MIDRSIWLGRVGRVAVLAAWFTAVAGVPRVSAQSTFPGIPVWSFAGAYQAGADSIREQPRTITLRWLRDPVAEARPDFGGYRIYRVTSVADTSRMTLIRRFSRQGGDSLFMWHFPHIGTATPESQRVATFIDPDSSGAFFKVCRQVDSLGRCLSLGDSVIKLVAPPGPHDGFRTWYAITYEGLNLTSNDFLDLFIPDTLTCQDPPFHATCPNLNHKARNLTSVPVEATRGPVANLQQVTVIPNPFRAAEAWDGPGENEVHFINLPAESRILIYTVAGDLVAELLHRDPIRDFERWNLKNGSGQDVGSGIYVYRVVAGDFSFQNRFVVIR